MAATFLQAEIPGRLLTREPARQSVREVRIQQAKFAAIVYPVVAVLAFVGALAAALINPDLVNPIAVEPPPIQAPPAAATPSPEIPFASPVVEPPFVARSYGPKRTILPEN